MAKLVDAPDSKSGAFNGVPVRLRLPVLPSLLKSARNLHLFRQASLNLRRYVLNGMIFANRAFNVTNGERP